MQYPRNHLDYLLLGGLGSHLSLLDHPRLADDLSPRLLHLLHLDDDFLNSLLLLPHNRLFHFNGLSPELNLFLLPLLHLQHHPLHHFFLRP